MPALHPGYPQKDYPVSNRDSCTTSRTTPSPIGSLACLVSDMRRSAAASYIRCMAENETYPARQLRVHAAVSGDIQESALLLAGWGDREESSFGIAGTPRVGLAYVPVRPGAGLAPRHQLRANVATGCRSRRSASRVLEPVHGACCRPEHGGHPTVRRNANAGAAGRGPSILE